VSGNIALISRGSCEFGQKSAFAGAAGATAAIIYNNVDGELSGTLGQAQRPEGPLVPTVGISKANATTILAYLNSTHAINARVETYSLIENRTTYVKLCTIGHFANFHTDTMSLPKPKQATRQMFSR
jgi:PA domain